MATGPRTEIGKGNASRNALRHGLFSTVVVLKGESHADYQALLRRLRKDRKPVGTLEEVWVEKLAMLLWRYRRFVVTEGVEIQKSTEFIEWDERCQRRKQAEEIEGSDLLESKSPLMGKIENPDALERCLELLTELRGGIEKDGFVSERDVAILGKLYPEPVVNAFRKLAGNPNWEKGVPEQIDVETLRKLGPIPNREMCKQSVLGAVDGQILRLKDQRTRNSIEADRMKQEVLCHGLPDSLSLDRLLRYEASLERALDRTLAQLERLQRMRRGQPVPSPIQVVSS